MVVDSVVWDLENLEAIEKAIMSYGTAIILFLKCHKFVTAYTAFADDT